MVALEREGAIAHRWMDNSYLGSLRLDLSGTSEGSVNFTHIGDLWELMKLLVVVERRPGVKNRERFALATLQIPRCPETLELQ